MGILSRKPNIEKLKGKRDVNGLIEALNHKDWLVRAQAADALGDIRAKPAVAALIKAMKEDVPCLPEAAVKALGKIGDEAAVPDIIRAALKKKHLVDTAATALRSIGSKSAGPILMEALDHWIEYTI